MSQSNPTEPTDSNQPSQPTPANVPAKARKRRRWPYVILALVVLLLLLVALLPTIASTSPVRSIVVGKINGSLNGTLAVSDWSIGWTTGVKIQGVKIDDNQGRRILEVASINVPVSLIGAARGNYDLGDLVIDKPNLVNLEVYADGSNNLQKLMKEDASTTKEKSTKEKTPSDGKLPDVKGKITINEARGTISGAGLPAPVYIDPSNFVVNIPSINSPIEDSGKLTYRVGQGAASTVSMAGTVDAIENNKVDTDHMTVDQKLDVANADLSAASPMLKKSDTTASLAGIANGSLAIKAKGMNDASVDGQFTVANFAYSGAALKGDTFKSSAIALPIKVSTSAAGSDTLIKIETLKVETDQVLVDVSGQATQQALQNVAANKAPGSAGQFAVAITSKDLITAIKSMPNAVPLQKDVTLNAAKFAARVDLALAADKATIKQSLDVEAAGTRATTQPGGAAQPIKLEPVHLDVAATAIPAGGSFPDLRDLAVNLTSAFATAKGGGPSISSIDLPGTVDLGKLNAQIAQFVDLGAKSVAGTGDFRITSKGDLTKADGTADVTANINLANVSAHGFAEGKDLNEPRLAVESKATLIRGPDGGEFVKGVKTASVTLQAGEAASPVVDLLASASNVVLGKLSVESFKLDKLNLDAAKAQQQFGSLFPGTIHATGGTIAVTANGSYQNDTLTFDQKAQVRGLALQSVTPGQPPQVLLANEDEDIALAGSVATAADKTVTATFTALSASSANKLFVISKSGDGPLTIRKKDKAIAGNGQLAIASDLKRVNDVIQAMGRKPGAAVATGPGQLTSGQLDATLKLASSDAGGSINLDGALSNLGVTTAQQPIQNEKVTINLAATTPADFSAMSVSSAVVNSSFAKTTVSETEIALSGGVFDMLKKAKIQIAIPDINKTMLVAQAFSPPSTQPATPTTQPVAPLEIGGGAVVNLDVTRDVAKQITHITIPEIAASKVSLVRGKRNYQFPKTIALNLAADITTEQPTTPASTQPTQQMKSLSVTKLDGDLGGLATLAMPQAIAVENLSTTPSANGKIALNGAVAPLMQMLSVIQDADAKPYQGDYVVGQNVSTDSSGAIKLAGDTTINKFVVLQTDGKTPAFSEDKIVLANDLTADTKTKTANITNVSLTMPSSQAAGLVLKGQVKDWEVQRQLNGVTCDLSYDLAKLWPMIKPMLSADQQKQFADLKIAGAFKQTFNVGGSYPASANGKPLAFNESIKPLTADGALAVQLLDTQGITINDLEIPLSLVNGQFTTLYANKPKAERAAKPAKFNGGALDLNSLLVDLTGDTPRLFIGKNQKLVAGASINSLLGDTLGKYVNPMFANSKRAKGLLDVTVEQCDRIALGEKLKSADSGNAKVTFSLTDMDIANPVGQLLFGPFFKFLGNDAANSQAETFNGYIKDAVIVVANGRTTQDVTMMLVDPGVTASAAAGQKAIKPIYMPMTFKGDINLETLKQELNVVLPQQFVGKLIPGGSAEKILNDAFPAGIPIVMRGTTQAPKVDVGNIAAKIAEGQAKSRLGDLLGGKKGDSKGTGGEKSSDPLGGLIDQLGGKKKEATPAPAPAPAPAAAPAPADTTPPPAPAKKKKKAS